MNIGDTLPAFQLLGTDHQKHTEEDCEKAKGVLLIVTCNHCPYARAYVDRIAALADAYSKKGIEVFAVSANDVERYPEDSFNNMIPMADQLHLAGRYLYDEEQELVAELGAERTPEVFLFDSAQKLIYTGAIDDNWEKPDEVKENYLKDALEALLKGKEVTNSKTQAVGCSIKWKPE